MATLEQIKKGLKETVDFVEEDILSRETYISSPFVEWKQDYKVEEFRKFLCCSFKSNEYAIALVESAKQEMKTIGKNPNEFESYFCHFITKLLREVDGYFKGCFKVCLICNKLIEKYNNAMVVNK